MEATPANPRVTLLLQIVTAVEVLVLVGAGGGLLLQPAVIGEIWPWALTPFNAAFLGAVYTASMATAALLVLVGRWSPARVAVPMILLFTAIVLVISLVYRDRFRLGIPSTWMWFILYVGIPLNAAYHVWLYRNLPPAGEKRLSAMWTGLLYAEAALFGLYGLGLLVAPEQFAAFWPWRVDALHGRMYSVAFLTPALGAWLLARSAAWAEVLTMATTLFAGGVLAIVGLVATDFKVHRVNWDAVGTWLWIGLFAVMALTGAGLWRTLGAFARPAGPLNESALIVPVRETALLLGIAFAAAGIAGFLPTFTHPAPHDAPALGISASYGYLLGLFPVNVIHSLFHLTLGVLGIAAYRDFAWSRLYVRGFAIVLSALTVMGLLPGLDTTLGLAPLFGHDVWLHGVEAVAAGYIGFVMPDSKSGHAEVQRSY